jgi:hypothetical protein
MIDTQSSVSGGTGYQPVAVGNLPAALAPQGLLPPSLTGGLNPKSNTLRPSLTLFKLTMKSTRSDLTLFNPKQNALASWTAAAMTPLFVTPTQDGGHRQPNQSAQTSINPFPVIPRPSQPFREKKRIKESRFILLSSVTACRKGGICH